MVDLYISPWLWLILSTLFALLFTSIVWKIADKKWQKRAEQKRTSDANQINHAVTAIMNQFQEITKGHFQWQVLSWQRKENFKRFIYEQIEGLMNE